jgi:hypothetical protein
MKVRIPLLVVAIALMAAACGTNDDSSELPINPNPDDTPVAVAGACVEEEPDCNDTAVITEEPVDLPGDSGGMLVDGGLSVSEALVTDATGTIAVKGFLVADDRGARLCELLAESMPPQCGGASIEVSGYEGTLSAPIQNAQGVSWTDDVVSVLGEIVEGVLVVDALSQ